MPRSPYTFALLLASVPSLGACGSADARDAREANEVAPVPVAIAPSDGASRPKGTRLYEIVPEPAGANCPNGGQAIVTGMDANSDGVIGASEVTSKSYVCNGANGSSPLLAMRPEPIGTACPTAGQAISWGYDLDNDGVLEPNEVKQTSYVCNGRNGLNGANGTHGTNGKSSLVTVIPQEPNAHCATGGQGIYTGIDQDGDGLLQPGEVKNSSFVCNGSNGASSLVRHVDEPAGLNCAHGGVRVLSGLDTNADGNLADAEATSSSYVCHGAPGAIGPQGLPGLTTKTTLTPEPPGANCSAGGQRLDAGADVNANGTLDPSEIAQTAYVCNAIASSTTSPAVLVREAPTPAGALCAGTRYSAGFDVDGDGSLQPSEVSSFVDLCTLVRVPTSSACAPDELPVEMGIDRDRDGVFDEDEIVGAMCVVKKLTSVSAGGGHTCAMASDGMLRCWGKNQHGQLGGGSYGSFSLAAVTPTLGAIVPSMLTTSASDTCAIARGIASCWGDNSAGQIKDRSWSEDFRITSPTQAFPGVAAISAGEKHICTIAIGTGVVTCRGSDQLGQLTGWSSSATSATAFATAVGVGAGVGHTSILRSDGTVRTWGQNNLTQLGIGWRPELPYGTSNANGINGVVAIAVGSNHTCALNGDGKVLCWGSPYSDTPQLVPALANVVEIRAGSQHTCALLSDGTVRCWGVNSNGQLGNGTTVNANLATVLGLSNVASISAGGNHSCALLRDGGLRCWGSNEYGQLGDGTTKSSSVPVTVGAL